jgi:hypothetical protein
MTEVAECPGATVPTAKARPHRVQLLLGQRLGEFMCGAVWRRDGLLRRTTLFKRRPP